MIKDSLEQLGGAVRWVPHELNPVDCFAKLKGNASALIDVLRSGKYKLTGEEEELKKRKEYREKTGMRNPRPNQSVSNSWQGKKTVEVNATFLSLEEKEQKEENDVVGNSYGHIGFICTGDLHLQDECYPDDQIPPAQTVCSVCAETLVSCSCSKEAMSQKQFHKNSPHFDDLFPKAGASSGKKPARKESQPLEKGRRLSSRPRTLDPWEPYLATRTA